MIELSEKQTYPKTATVPTFTECQDSPRPTARFRGNYPNEEGDTEIAIYSDCILNKNNTVEQVECQFSVT